jgi:hypothetical protein
LNFHLYLDPLQYSPLRMYRLIPPGTNNLRVFTCFINMVINTVWYIRVKSYLDSINKTISSQYELLCIFILDMNLSMYLEKILWIIDFRWTLCSHHISFSILIYFEVRINYITFFFTQKWYIFIAHVSYDSWFDVYGFCFIIESRLSKPCF